MYDIEIVSWIIVRIVRNDFRCNGICSKSCYRVRETVADMRYIVER